jgi:hypothetical protein
MLALGRTNAFSSLRARGFGKKGEASGRGFGRTQWFVVSAVGLAAASLVWLTESGLWGRAARTELSRTVLAGSPGGAWLERVTQPNGESALRGETRISASGSRGSVVITEEAHLDAHGRLVSAEVQVAFGAIRDAARALSFDRLSLDAERGWVTVTANGKRRTRRVPTDLPWIYAAPGDADGAPAITPVAAMVAERASELAGALRLFDARGRDNAVTSDQVSVAGGGERWIVLGDDVATFAATSGGRDELMQLRLAAPGLQMTASHNP